MGRPRSFSHHRPLGLLVVAGAAGAGVLLPLIYLLLRAMEAEWGVVQELVFRPRNLYLLGNTLGLTAGVLIMDTLIAVPLAWLLTRTELATRRWLVSLAVLPLAIPGYVMATALLGLGGSYGALARLTGLSVPRLGGYWGALLCISLYTFPYVFINVRTALAGLPRNLEEAARSLGYTPRASARRVVLPQLVPALLSSWLVVGLYTLGDFGAVSLMRYESFSYAIYLQYAGAFDRTYAAWLALMLLTLAGGIVFVHSRLQRGKSYHAVGSATPGGASPAPLGHLRWAAYAYLLILFFLSLGVPIGTLGFWLFQRPLLPELSSLASSAIDTLSVALPAAALAGVLAAAVSYLSVRWPGKLTQALAGAPYIGYATPPLAFGLALVFFGLRGVPWLYQTTALLSLGLALHLLALAVGPVRSTLLQTPPRLEEGARALGRSWLRAFLEVTGPLMGRGVLAGTALVCIVAMKELPITILLAPPGFSTLATQVFSYTSEALFAQAAPYALAIVFLAAPLVTYTLGREVNG